MKRYHVSKNLFDGTDISGAMNNLIYKNDFVYANLSQGTYTLAFDLKTTATGTYASSIGVGTTTYSKDIQIQSGKTDGHFVFTFTIGAEDAGKNLYARFARFATAKTITYTASNIMLNIGTTPLPYEPYGNTQNRIPYRQYHLNATSLTSDEITTDGQPIGANLFDIDSVTHQALSSDGTIRYESAMDLSGFIKVNGNFTVSWTAVRTGAYMRVSTYDDNKNFIARIAEPNTYTRNSYSNTHTGYIRINYENSYQLSDIMFNTGSTALPYQPYAPAIISGNTTQSGTPTPDNPIMPQGTGERTNNLFDKTDILSGYEIINNQIVTNSAWGVSDYIPVEQGKYYIATNTGSPILEYETIGGTAVRSGISIVGGNYTPSATTRFIRINFKLVNLDDIMLNTGSTALPYEPYGYKIPISSAGQTTPIYLGEVQTTRKIKKLVLTGNETATSVIQTTDGNNYCIAYKYSDLGMTDILDYDAYTYNCDYPVFVSTHFTMKSIAGATLPNAFNDISAGEMGGNTWKEKYDKPETFNGYLIFCVAGITTLADFRAWLAAQYANGTPVTVWYILASETTGIVNEPLRKIGAYADSISVTNIPTIAGPQQFAVNTTLAPSDIKLSNWWETINYEKIRKNNDWWINNSVAYWQQFTIGEMQQKTIYELQGGD